MVQQTIDYGLQDIDDAIRQGLSSFEIWTRFGRRQGLTLEDIVMRRRSIQRPPPRRRGPRRRAEVLPLFAPRPAMG